MALCLTSTLKRRLSIKMEALTADVGLSPKHIGKRLTPVLCNACLQGEFLNVNAIERLLTINAKPLLISASYTKFCPVDPLLASCFGFGYWIDLAPWTNDVAWKYDK